MTAVSDILLNDALVAGHEKAVQEWKANKESYAWHVHAVTLRAALAVAVQHQADLIKAAYFEGFANAREQPDPEYDGDANDCWPHSNAKKSARKATP